MRDYVSSEVGAQLLRNFEDFGRGIAEPEIRTLKFSKGRYFVNNGVKDFPFEYGKLVAKMPTLRTGWVRYDSGFIVKTIMGKVGENFQPPGREDLGDDDKSEWGEDEHGQPHDPWCAIWEIVVFDPDRDIYDRNSHFLLTLDSSNNAGVDWARYWGYDICEMQSLGILCQVYAAHARRAPDELPVIELTSRVLFTNPECGVVSIPQINVVDWWSEERSTAAERTAKLMEKVAEQARQQNLPRARRQRRA